ncbi:YitT family protein [Bacillus aerolatus]|uniref:YitT family protein n=2 Tax=Bacillus aerolatus TaxID=2653354 RepID=A0A6I1FKW4_9BACI|nr:YitT family protein [Bacillus aerolatus]
MAGLTFGAFVQGIAMTFFLFPHHISSGGAAGISIILNFLFQTPYAAALWALNAIMIFIAFKRLGKSSAAGTMFCVTVTAVTIHLFSPFVSEPLSHPAFDLTAGAVIFGTGLGILFRLGASSGGMDILALIISKWRGLKPGKTLFYINSSILLLTGLIVDVKTIFYAVACQWIAGKMIDMIGMISTEKLPILRLFVSANK